MDGNHATTACEPGTRLTVGGPSARGALRCQCHHSFHPKLPNPSASLLNPLSSPPSVTTYRQGQTTPDLRKVRFAPSQGVKPSLSNRDLKTWPRPGQPNKPTAHRAQVPQQPVP